MVKFNEETQQYEYFDKYGQPIYNGDYLLMNGKMQRIYQTDRDDKALGTDATNPQWVLAGRADPCDYGIYELTFEETEDSVCYSRGSGSERNIFTCKHDCTQVNILDLEYHIA